jgi:hypothetical protein
MPPWWPGIILNCIRPLVSPSPASAAFHSRILSLQALEKMRPSVVWRNGDIDRGKRGLSLYLVLSLRHLLRCHQARHLPGNVTPIWKCNYTTDYSRAEGIPERL